MRKRHTDLTRPHSQNFTCFSMNKNLKWPILSGGLHLGKFLEKTTRYIHITPLCQILENSQHCWPIRNHAQVHPLSSKFSLYNALSPLTPQGARGLSNSSLAPWPALYNKYWISSTIHLSQILFLGIRQEALVWRLHRATTICLGKCSSTIV